MQQTTKKGQPVLLILLPDYFQMLLNRFAALLNYSSILACLFELCKKNKQEDLALAVDKTRV